MDNIKDHITIKNIIFLLLILGFLKCIAEMQDLALMLFASFVIASSLNPLVNKMSKYMKRSISTTLAILGFMALVLGALIPLTFVIVDKLNIILANLPAEIASMQNYLDNVQILGRDFNEIIDMTKLNQNSSAIMSNVVGKSIEVSLNAVSAITVMFIASMIIFYLVSEKDTIKDWLLNLFPPSIRKQSGIVIHNISTKVGGFIIAQSTSMLAVGICTAIGLLILRVDYAVILGLIAGLLDIIPIVGPIVATVLAIIVAAKGGWLMITAVISVYIIAQWISNNFIRPLIFGKFMDLHPLVIIIAFLVAAHFLNVWGVILAPAMAAAIAVIFDEIYIKQINKKTTKEQNV